MVRLTMRLREETSRRQPFKIHVPRIQRCQTSPRQIWYPSMEVKDHCFVLAKLLAQGDLMREQPHLAPWVLKTSYRTLTFRSEAAYEPHNLKDGSGRVGCNGATFFSRDVSSKSRMSRNIGEDPRRSAVNQTVLDSSARCETALSMELRAAQLNNDSAMEMRDREIVFKIGNEAPAALRHDRAHMVTELNIFVLEGDAQRYHLQR